MISIHKKFPKGMTLVELLVALAVSSILMLGVVAAFQTVQRTAAIGEAREHIFQNGRVALDLMSKEIRSAYIDNRNRDLVFISADGLAGRGSSILEFSPNPPAAPTAITFRGLGNAQTPHGIDPTGNFVFGLYADDTFGSTALSVKALDDIHTLSPGPPDRLDFTCMTSNYPGNTTNQSRLAEVRYCVTTETFVDDVDNDYTNGADEADDIPPGAGGLQNIGDLIPMSTRDDLHPETGKIKALSLFHLRRAIDTSVDKNPFSSFEMATGDGTPADPQGRYPARDLGDFDMSNDGENIGSYIYDMQFEFFGKIAIALDSNGAPEVWGVGWGYQDVRGEDVGVDSNGPAALSGGTVSVTKGSDAVDGTLATGWPATADELVDGLFIVWPSGATEFDATDPDNDVYTIADSTSTTITLNRDYSGDTDATANYRIIEPTQANGVLDSGEDLGADGLLTDPLDNMKDDGTYNASATGIPNNVSDNDGATGEASVGEGNERLDSRVMGIWDSRSPDPRNPRRAAELNNWDDDSDFLTLSNNSGKDDDQDGQGDDRLANYYDKDGNLLANPNGAQFTDYATPESDTTGTSPDESNDLIDNDSGGTDGIADDRFYEPAGRPEGIDEPDEADPDDDSLPKAVRITIAVSDPAQALDPVVLSTTVWLSTAR